MIRQFIEKVLVNEQKRFDDIRVYIEDSRIELSFINDKYKNDFERDDFESFKKDVHRIGAIVDDIDEYLVDLRNSKKRIDKIQKLLGLFEEKD